MMRRTFEQALRRAIEEQMDAQIAASEQESTSVWLQRGLAEHAGLDAETRVRKDRSVAIWIKHLPAASPPPAVVSQPPPVVKVKPAPIVPPLKIEEPVRQRRPLTFAQLQRRARAIQDRAQRALEEQGRIYIGRLMEEQAREAGPPERPVQ
jgi:hypothetical protein